MVHRGQHKSTSSLRVFFGCAGLVLATIVFAGLRARRAPAEPGAAAPATASARYAFVGVMAESVPTITDQTGSVLEKGVVNVRHAGGRQLWGANREQLPDDQFSVKLGNVEIKSSESLDFSSENVKPGLMWLPIGLQDVSSGDPWVTMCLMDYKKYQDKPSATPMFANMVAMSKCGRGNKDGSGNPGVGAAAVVRMSNLLKSITESGLEPVPPKGFIYHETRCGSTLAANMLAALPPSRVFSEAKPPVQGIRMCIEAECDSETITKVFHGTVALMGRRRSEGEHHEHLYFKFQNSKFLPEISAAFPEVPWVFVFRDPVEVMVSNLRSLQAGPCVRIPRQERFRVNGGGGEKRGLQAKLPGGQIGMKGRGWGGGIRRLAGVAELRGEDGGGLASPRARMLGGADAETDPWKGSWPTDSDGGSVARAGYQASEARDPWRLSETNGRSMSSRKAGLALGAIEADKGEGAGIGGVFPVQVLLEPASPSKHEADSYDYSYTISDDSLDFSRIHRLVAVEGVGGGVLAKIRRRLAAGKEGRPNLLASRKKEGLSAAMCKECADWLKMLCDAAVKASDDSPQTALFVDYSNMPEAMPEHVFPTHFGLKHEMDQAVPNWKDLMYEAAGTYSKGGLRGKSKFAGDAEQKHKEASPLIIQAAEVDGGLYDSYDLLKSLQSWRRPED